MSARAVANFDVVICDGPDTVRCSLADFESANAECMDPAEIERVRALRPGETIPMGGGAAPEVTITRVYS